jgi:hypothetical protein
MSYPSPRPPFSRFLRSRLAAWRPFLAGVAIGLVALFLVGLAAAAPPDHASFDQLLRANVRAGVVDYPAFQESPAFRRYVASLAAPATLEGKAQALAYYINAYNALAIAGILEGLSPSTFLGRTRYFRIKTWPLNGRSISLHDLEHEVIRRLGEPRIHFAIVCASRSCPALRAEAYAPGTLDAQLDEQARNFINDRFRNRFDPSAKAAQLSEIFKWFDEDFRAAAGSTQEFIARYASNPDTAELLAEGGFGVEWIRYDWNLNGTPPRRD